MRYRIEHEFPCDRDTLIRTMFEKGVIELLRPSMTKMLEAETLLIEERDDKVFRRTRYLPVPKIDSVGPKKVDPRWMEWIEHSEADLKTRIVKYRNEPTTPRVAELLKNSGSVEFLDLGPHRTRRALVGELRVEVFLLGMIAERLIYGYAKEIVDEEAGALTRLIQSRAGG